ncbi:MAG TPA: FKBP-type peptidyl-prolyl cis-trans isomerase [Chitinophagaceae bacterium]|nr:FKBP-type peptidyl-prolyl cis-trans isomerase [Chitinophagaceae bacterium]
MAQTKTAAKPATAAKPSTAAKPATPATLVLKNAMDSMSYAIGVLDGTFFKTQGISKVNSTLLGKGFSDVIGGQAKMTSEQANEIVRREMQKMTLVKIQPNIQACNNFLADNKKKPGVVTTASGLQYEVIKMGTGPKPADTSTVMVHYEGFLLNASRPFDSSRERGEPISFQLNQVIRGWTEGVQLMPVGSRFKFYIPYQLGYGEQGSRDVIPGGSLLIFDVELLDIVKNQ